MRLRTLLVVLMVAAAGSWPVHGGVRPPRPERVDDTPPAKAGPAPTDVSMHDFMEGVFQGPYRRLKTAIAAEPKDNAGWKAIRSDALILAEGGNLVLLRKPEKDAQKWAEYSIASREAGAGVFKAAKKKEYATARKAYGTMITACNACHTHFDGGKNRLVAK
jgi:hypothetical protein